MKRELGRRGCTGWTAAAQRGALAQPLSNHAPRPSIMREGPGQSELQKCYEPLNALTGSLAAQKNFCLAATTSAYAQVIKTASHCQVTQCTTKKNSSAHNPRQFCFSQKGSSCQNIPCFSLTFDSEINRYPERTTGRLGRATIGPSGAELDGGFGVKQERHAQGSMAHAKRDAKGGAP